MSEKLHPTDVLHTVISKIGFDHKVTQDELFDIEETLDKIKNLTDYSSRSDPTLDLESEFAETGDEILLDEINEMFKKRFSGVDAAKVVASAIYEEENRIYKGRPLKHLAMLMDLALAHQIREFKREEEENGFTQAYLNTILNTDERISGFSFQSMEYWSFQQDLRRAFKNPLLNSEIEEGPEDYS